MSPKNSSTILSDDKTDIESQIYPKIDSLEPTHGQLPVIMVSEPDDTVSKVITNLPVISRKVRNMSRYKHINQEYYDRKLTSKKIKSQQQFPNSGSNETQKESLAKESGRSINSRTLSRLTLPHLTQCSVDAESESVDDSISHPSLSILPNTFDITKKSGYQDGQTSPTVPSAPPATPTSFNEWPGSKVPLKSHMDVSKNRADMGAVSQVSLKKSVTGKTSLGVKNVVRAHRRYRSEHRLKARGNGECCKGCLSKMKNAPSASLILLPFHIFLLVLLGSYLAIGAFMFMSVDGGIRVVTGPDPDFQEETGERLLNRSMGALLDESKEAVLGTIFTSDIIQAALRSFSTGGVRFLPTDTQLDILSDQILRKWRRDLVQIIKKHDIIASHGAIGFQGALKENDEFWNSEILPDGLNWDYWSALLHSFCLITTIGGGVRARFSGGRVLTVFYTGVGFVLYYFVIVAWATRLIATLVIVHKTVFVKKQNEPPPNPNPQEAPKIQWRDNNVQKPPWPPLVLLTSCLTVGYILGLGPLAMGPSSIDYGIRLEAAILSLSLVTAPHPLPQGGEGTSVFIAYIVVGHIILLAVFYSVKDFMNRILPMKKCCVK